MWGTLLFQPDVHSFWTILLSQLFILTSLKQEFLKTAALPRRKIPCKNMVIF